MKIVQIEDFFHPETGYQINILSKIWSSMGHEVHILTSSEKHVPRYLKDFLDFEKLDEKDEEYSVNYNVYIKRFDALANISNRMIFKKDILKYAFNLSPDIIYIHGNDTYIGIKVATILNKLKIPVIMDSHMIEIASKNKFSSLFQLFYRKFITPKLVKSNIFILKTASTNFINTKYDYPSHLSPVLGFGSDLSLFNFEEKNRAKLRNEFGISNNQRVFIYAGKLDKSKGIEVLVNAIKEKFDCLFEPVFIFIGNPNFDYDFLNQVKLINNLVIHLNTQKYKDLPKFFHMSDIMVIPAQNSLTFYDAQAAGLPCILSFDSINADRVNHENGVTFETSNSQDLRKKIKEYLNSSIELINKQKTNSINFVSMNYNYLNIASKYLDYMYQTIDNYK